MWERALELNDRATPERKAQFERDLRAMAHQIGDETVRRHYLADIAERLAGLWRTANGEWRTGKRGTRPHSPFDTRHSLKKPWDLKTPPSPQLRALAGSGQVRHGIERRERMIVLSMVNHPELLHEVLDEFAALDLTTPELDSLRAKIIDSAAFVESLDAAGLKAHLTQRGSGPLLDRLETQARRLNEWFLGSGAAHDDARTGLRQMIALHRKTVTLERELKAVEAVFAAEPTEDNLNALNAVREQLSAQAGIEARIEGFGAASGRPVAAIT